MLLYEAGKFSDAKSRFMELVKLSPRSALRLEADLRIGLCQVQTREFGPAVKTLTPLVDKLITDQTAAKTTLSADRAAIAADRAKLQADIAAAIASSSST